MEFVDLKLSLNILKKYWFIVLPSASFSLVVLLLFYFSPYPFFFNMGFLSLRVFAVQNIEVVDVYIFILISFLSSLVMAFSFLVISNVSVFYLKKGKRLFTFLKDKVENHLLRLSLFFFVFPLLSFVFVYLFYYLNFPLAGQLFMFIFSYLLFYFPYSLAVDDVSASKSLSLSLRILRKHPLIPIVWMLFVSLLLFLIYVIVYSIFDAYELAAFILNSVFVLPFSTILASVMYMRRYPLARGGFVE